MNTPRMFLCLAILASVVGLPPAIGSQRKSDSSNLDSHKVKSGLQDASIRDSVIYALKQAGVPGGISVSHYCGGFQSHSLSPANDSLRSFLDAAVAADPGYAWSVDNGVVNLVQRYDEPVFLRMIIPNMEITEAETTNQALDKLLAIPEVEKQVRLELGIRTFGGGVGGYPRVATTKISLSLSNVTVRQALNAIARTRGDAIWVLTNQKCLGPTGRKFFELQFTDLDK